MLRLQWGSCYAGVTLCRKRICENEAAYAFATLGALCTAFPRVRALPEGSPEDFRAWPRALPKTTGAERCLAGRVAKMASVLEIFRRHAPEARRLSPVEKRAHELKGKIERLGDALASLYRMLGQIVRQEKPAAPGELTAGVVHEIGNPLNVVKDFPEELRASNRQNNEEPAMGQGRSRQRPTGINALLNERVRRAFRSARANGPDCRPGIIGDFDLTVGLLVVNSQDVGRVVLNPVGDVCRAAVEKRRSSEESGGGARYEPLLTLGARRSGKRMEIRVKDNGSGVSPEIIETMFNPFVTTRPADRALLMSFAGTGMRSGRGLSQGCSPR